MSSTLYRIHIHLPRQAKFELSSITRPTETEASGRRSVPDPMTSLNSGSWRLRFPNWQVKNSREPRNHLEPGRNLVVDWNVVVLTKIDLVSPTVGTNYRGFMMNNETWETWGFRQVRASLWIITLRPGCVVVWWCLGFETPSTPPFIVQGGRVYMDDRVGTTVHDSNSISTCSIYQIWFYIYPLNCPGYGPPGSGP
jgi:hypothetical protein